MGLGQGRKPLPQEVLLTATAGELSVPFDPRGLRNLYATGALAIVLGVAMIFAEYVLLGMTVPTPLRIAFGMASVGLGCFLGVSARRRARTDEPALQVHGDQLFLHVNPGRRVTLDLSEIKKVGEVRLVGPRWQRIFLGQHVFEIQTTRSEGLRASTVLVGSTFIFGDLRACRENLVLALRG